MSAARCRLYVLTPPQIPDLAGFARQLDETLAAGDVAAVQLRLKAPVSAADGAATDVLDAPPAPDSVMEAAGRALLEVTRAHAVPLLINDRPEVATALGADGVHIGQTDASYNDARRLLGPDAVIGVTCHDDGDLAIAAAQAGADYVAFGAFFPTGTKTPKSHAHPQLLHWWAALSTTPSVAIGGITPDNCTALAAAGADFVAASAALWSAPEGPAAAARAFAAALEAADGPPPNPFVDTDAT